MMKVTQSNERKIIHTNHSPRVLLRRVVLHATCGAALIWAHSAFGALPRPTVSDNVWTCSDRISNLYLSGSFIMPGSGERLQLMVGKPKLGNSEAVQGILAKAGSDTCEALCRVRKFERYEKDKMPALMELDCEGTSIKTLRMPLHVQWLRSQKGFDSIVRLGSSIYGVEESKIRIDVNRYSVAQKIKANGNRLKTKKI